MRFFKWNWMLILTMVMIVGFVTMGILQKGEFREDLELRDAEILGLKEDVEFSEKRVLDREGKIEELELDAVKREEAIEKVEKMLTKVEAEKWVLKKRMVRIPPTEVVAKTIAEIMCDGIRMFRLDGEASVVFSEECAGVNLGFLEKFSLAEKEVERLEGEKEGYLGKISDLENTVKKKDGIIGERDLQIEDIRRIVQEKEGDLIFAISDGKRTARKKFWTGTAIGAGIVFGISLLTGK